MNIYLWKLSMLVSTVTLPTLTGVPSFLIHGFAVKYFNPKSWRFKYVTGFLTEEPTWYMISLGCFAWATMATSIAFTTMSAGTYTLNSQYLFIAENTTIYFVLCSNSPHPQLHWYLQGNMLAFLAHK